MEMQIEKKEGSTAFWHRFYPIGDSGACPYDPIRTSCVFSALAVNTQELTCGQSFANTHFKLVYQQVEERFFLNHEKYF